MSARTGAIADPGGYNDDIKRLVARGHRDTSSSTTTTEVGVLLLEGVEVKAGRAYEIYTPVVHVQSNAGDVVALRLRYTTDGSTASTSSTELRYAQTTIRTGTPDEPIAIIGHYYPGSDQSLSILLSVVRVGGAGNSFVVASSVKPIELLVCHMGLDTGDIGIDI